MWRLYLKLVRLMFFSLLAVMAEGDLPMARTPTELLSPPRLTLRLATPSWFLVRPQLLTLL
jgi:hypothetical protein